MLRRLATLALTLSLATTALVSPAAARSFARAPEAESADAAGAARAPRIVRLPDETPRISPAARAKLRQVLRSHRAKNVNAFSAYANRGVYPHNYVTRDSLNVWIDEDGHMCAAATMIFKSGAKKMVRKIGAEQNYIKLGDVTEGPVMDWILTSGLTQTEVATIQEPFMGEPAEPAPDPNAWKLAEDARLRNRYAEVLQILAADPDASIDAALDRLAFRPDLVAKLLRS